MKKLPLGIQTFKDIIQDNYLYIDKTKDLYNLIKDGGKYYFISRPRRFGKSLLVSTLKEIFSGNKELFKGLWIYDKLEWKKHPVIHIDFSGMDLRTPETFLNNLENRMSDLLKDNNFEVDEKKSYKENFRFLMEKLSKQEKVVILIDEYDKPIVNFVDNIEIANKNREILKNFYETIKESDQYIRFAFLTGVSKFSKVSVFSGLNNLRDITLEEKFATIAGYTENELFNYFDEYIKSTSDKLHVTPEFLKDTLKDWYNGYSWDGKNFVYNPYSILSVFTVQKINNYWFQSGTPTFLIKLIKEKSIEIKKFENIEASAAMLDSFEIENIDVESLLFQTGYLTIKEIIEYSISERVYILSYPNTEVKESLLKNILNNFLESGNNDILVGKLYRSLNKNNLEEFFNILNDIFINIPAVIFMSNKEAYYHTIIYLILTLIGVKISVEVYTNKGRIDAVIETETHIYVIEFKMSNSKEAIKQIEAKKYYEKYISSGKTITLIGIAFNMKERNIGSYLVKNLLE